MKTKRTRVHLLVAALAAFAAAAAVGIFGTRPLGAQSPAPAFDAADVHVRPHSSNTNPNPSGGVLRGGRYDLRNATMVDLISMAYGVDGDMVLGGPNWLERDRFDIIAKAPQTTSPDTVKVMLQNLLADRFKLVLRKDTKPVQGFVLTMGSGKHKMKEADGNAPPTCQGQPPPQPGNIPYNIASCHNLTMEVFAQQLRGMAGAYITGPVADQTGLKGAWDFDLKWTARALLAQAGSDGISLSDAIDKQLGLKLESRQVPTPVIVVESVNQKPADNPSGVAQNFPAPPPAEFDVADIKVSPPGTNQMLRILPGGRIEAQAATLKMLITIAWNIIDDELLAGPKWLDETRFSMVARVSSAAVGGSAANAPQLDIDDVSQMLRALLIERFKMKTHYEDRPVTAYTLVAAKPKLAKADPSNRTGCKEGPPTNIKDPRDSNPILARLVTCRNITMPELAEDLQRIAPGYLHNPVIDGTGLDGSWDFTFNFSPVGAVQLAGRGGDGGQSAGAPAASVPTGALTLFDALDKQLGLKLEMHKRPMPVLVIDHVEEKPTEKLIHGVEWAVNFSSAAALYKAGGNGMKRTRLQVVTAACATFAAATAICLLGGRSLRAQAQTPARPDDVAPKFEVASIKANKSGDRGMQTRVQPGGRFTATNVPLRFLILFAFQLQDFQIVGGPDWIASEHFDIVAKTEGDSALLLPTAPGTVGTLQLMLRSLIEERFKLAVHQEKRDLPIYALVVARSDGKLGSNLQPSTADCQAMIDAAMSRGGLPPGPPPSTPSGRPICGMRMAPGQMMGGGFPLSQLATAVSQIVGRTVVDRTGLEGNFDLELTFTPDQMPQGRGDPPPGAPPLSPIDPNGPSIFTAIQEQLGLKLESTKGPVDVLVIDRVERPTED